MTYIVHDEREVQAMINSVNRFLVMLMSDTELMMEHEEQHATILQFKSDFLP